MKIIKDAEFSRYRIFCKVCSCRFEADEKEIDVDGLTDELSIYGHCITLKGSIVCPECKNRLFVMAVRKVDDDYHPIDEYGLTI